MTWRERMSAMLCWILLDSLHSTSTQLNTIHRGSKCRGTGRIQPTTSSLIAWKKSKGRLYFCHYSFLTSSSQPVGGGSPEGRGRKIIYRVPSVCSKSMRSDISCSGSCPSSQSFLQSASIIIIVIIISFMQGIYTYIPEANYVPREYSVAAILLLLFMVLI